MTTGRCRTCSAAACRRGCFMISPRNRLPTEEPGMNIVFHGSNAASFAGDFSALLTAKHTVTLLPDRPTSAEHQASFSAAEVIVSAWFDDRLPPAERLR